MIISSQVDKIFITHKDRLLRFGFDLIINIAKEFGNRGYYIKSKRKKL